MPVEIRPKIPLFSVLFMVAYAVDRVRWSTELAHWDREAGLTDLVADAFCRAVERATRRGLLGRYRRVEEAARAPRARCCSPSS